MFNQISKRQEMSYCDHCQQSKDQIIRLTKKCNHSLCVECIEEKLMEKKQNMNNCAIDKCKFKIDYKWVLIQISNSGILKKCQKRKEKQIILNSKKEQIENIETQTNDKYSTCRKCNKLTTSLCTPCMFLEVEDVAKQNYYSKHSKLGDLLQFGNTLVNEKVAALQKKFEDLDLICAICRDFMDQPLVCCINGHEFCKSCLYQLKVNENNENGICPLCKHELLLQTPENLRTKKLIQSLVLDCPKCDLKVEFNEFIRHFRSCIERKISCDSCSLQIEQQFNEIHKIYYCIESDCPFGNCGKKIKEHENIFFEHLVQAMKSSDIVYTFNLRLRILEKYLFNGTINTCQFCDQQVAWKLEQINGQVNNEYFCFNCFRIG